MPYGAGPIGTREGIGTTPVTRAEASAEFAAGERTGLPFGGHAEGLRTQDLGNQEVGPYNTEGARASPILTEEDRGIDTTVRRERIRTTRRDVTDRPAMSASEDTTVVTPMAAEELEARRRTMTDEELETERRRVSDTSSDDVGGPKRIGIDPEEFSKRGF